MIEMAGSLLFEWLSIVIKWLSAVVKDRNIVAKIVAKMLLWRNFWHPCCYTWVQRRERGEAG